MQKKQQEDVCFRTTIGGQALIEGIMMLGPDKSAVVVRTSEGLVEQVEDRVQAKDKHKILGVPLIRGVVNFMASMVKGTKALMYSAALAGEEATSAEQETKADRQTSEDTPSAAQPEDSADRRETGGALPEQEAAAAQAETEAADQAAQVPTLEADGASTAKAKEEAGDGSFGQGFIWLAVLLGIGFSVGLFILLPTLLAGFIIPTGGSMIWRNLLEGGLRILIFLVYLIAMSRLKDIRRVFSYHGAEHKTIYCYEKGLELTVDNVRAQPRHHPRCGTSFLFVIVILSILIFSLVQWSNIWVRMGMRLLLLPVVVAIGYELNRLVGRHDNALTRVLTAPGLWLQNFTTNEPDDDMIEVGISALRAVLPRQEGTDAW